MAKGWSITKRRKANIRQTRRKTVYKITAKRNGGRVPCFVCGDHVVPENATLEHIVPLSKGGTDDMENLAISHGLCNQRRGNGD